MRTAILDMLKHDIQIKNPYNWFKIPQTNTKEIYLDHEELDAMRKLRPKFFTHQQCIKYCKCIYLHVIVAYVSLI